MRTTRMYENFLAYRRYFWGKLTLATTLILVISYIFYSRRVSPTVATLVGLTYPLGHSTDDELRKIIRQMRALAADKSQEFTDACQAEIEYGIPKRHVGWGLL